MTPSRSGIFSANRRFFLRGLGATLVGLPFLESFVPRSADAQTQSGVFRYALFMRQGNGVQQQLGNDEPDRFWPTNLGTLTPDGMRADGDQAVNVLADYAAKLLVVRGTEMVLQVDAGCGHSAGGLLCLTAARADGKNAERALAMGESIDNRIERELSGAGKDPLTLRAGERQSYLDDVLSYRGQRDRRVAESIRTTRIVHFLACRRAHPAMTTRRALRRKSVNDLVRTEMDALMKHPRLSASDKNRLEQHRAAIRDVETALTCTLPTELLATLSATTTQIAESDDAIVPTLSLHARVMALAVACGRTHAGSLQVGNGNDQTQYTINGTKYERYHHISHRINSDSSEGSPIDNAALKHHDIDKLFAGIFAHW